jgi:transcriptional regulator with XRE-family HTH domain
VSRFIVYSTRLCYYLAEVNIVEYDRIAIGNRAYEARKTKNLSQENVSKALGIHQTTYSKFENGRFDMSTSKLIKLCNLYGISVSWLLGETIVPDLTDSERLEVEKFIKYITSIRQK